MGTVGAVAVDKEGNTACATSTGGMINQMEGRIGDTPCVGKLFVFNFTNTLQQLV